MMLWMCIIKRDDQPAEIAIGPENAMRHLYRQASQHWSECYLLQIIEGPRDTARDSAKEE